VFVVETGTAVFTAGEEQLTTTEGHIVVVPEQTPHGFQNPGDETLRGVSIHPARPSSRPTSRARPLPQNATSPEQTSASHSAITALRSSFRATDHKFRAGAREKVTGMRDFP
jgi:oxalate decarboxylase/phosphoglucose isomerase-like protein (cupin superfamily)